MLPERFSVVRPPFHQFFSQENWLFLEFCFRLCLLAFQVTLESTKKPREFTVSSFVHLSETYAF